MTAGPSIEIVKVDRGWYTYRIVAQGMTVMGHGSREHVYRAVNDALKGKS